MMGSDCKGTRGKGTVMVCKEQLEAGARKREEEEWGFSHATFLVGRGQVRGFKYMSI
jgi:hypothetical protein